MTSSIDDHDGEDRTKKKEKTRKPGNTAFRQQRLKAWQPILTPKTVLPLFFVIGIIFAPIGGLLLYASAQVQELVIDYTDCDKASSKLDPIPSSKYHASFRSPMEKEPMWKVERNKKTDDERMKKSNPNYKETVCTIEFALPHELDPPIFVYYRLSNFYQNHRRYVQSFDKAQLSGTARTKAQLDRSGDCDPLTGDGGKPYYPCGLIANSIFNDTFLPRFQWITPTSGEKPDPYQLSNKGIAWASDRERFGRSKYNPQDVIPPPYWVERYPQNYTQENMPNFEEDEEFQVWMRTAGLPTFSKLALRNDNDKLSFGRWAITIYYRFPVREYSGTKSIVISTRTVMGGRNIYLGVAYVVVGGLCVLLGTLFTFRHLIKPRKLGDHTYLSWNNEDTVAQVTARDT